MLFLFCNEARARYLRGKRSRAGTSASLETPISQSAPSIPQEFTSKGKPPKPAKSPTSRTRHQLRHSCPSQALLPISGKDRGIDSAPVTPISRLAPHRPSNPPADTNAHSPQDGGHHAGRPSCPDNRIYPVLVDSPPVLPEVQELALSVTKVLKYWDEWHGRPLLPRFHPLPTQQRLGYSPRDLDLSPTRTALSVSPKRHLIHSDRSPRTRS